MFNNKKTTVEKHTSIGVLDFSKKMDGRFSECKAIESMKKGYENMAEINLIIAEIGIQDYSGALIGYERNLNGDEKISDD